jgi:hypothetical protein
MNRNEQQNQAIVDSVRWQEIENTLKQDIPYGYMDRCLMHYGVRLADFDPKGYNSEQVARDSDGQMSNQEP